MHESESESEVSQSCQTLCDPIDSLPPGSSVPGILQARTLEWVAISFSNAWKWKAKVKSLSPVRLLATPWTTAYQALLSMGFSRQEYWSGVPLPSPNMLSRLVITFLPRSKCLLISWLQSPSAVIWEPKKIKSDTVSKDSFQIGKGVCQGCIWSPCLFNLYIQSTSREMLGWKKHKLESNCWEKYQ